MDSIGALRRSGYYKDRDPESCDRVTACHTVADVIDALEEAELRRHGQADGWQSPAGRPGLVGSPMYWSNRDRVQSISTTG